MPFDFQPQAIPGLVLIGVKGFGDARGLFRESYKRSAFEAAGIREAFVQDNLSRSTKGVLRGLHYQKPPSAQGKLVMAIAGEVFDVAVDLRKGSPTYAQWVGVVLSRENSRMLYVPPGFAHAYCVLSEDAEVLYKCTAEYAPPLDRGVIWNDPEIGVRWPVTEPLLSAKDAKLPLLKDADNPFVWEGGRAGA